MTQRDGLTPEERLRLIEILDQLIDRYVEQNEAFEKGDNVRAQEIKLEIKELQRKRERIQGWRDPRMPSTRLDGGRTPALSHPPPASASTE
jgi:hypothetical protein